MIQITKDLFEQADKLLEDPDFVAHFRQCLLATFAAAKEQYPAMNSEFFVGIERTVVAANLLLGSPAQVIMDHITL